MPNKNIAWLEKLAKWQGAMETTIKDLIKNQDELNINHKLHDERIRNLRNLHFNCREEMLKTVTSLQKDAEHIGKRWGFIVGLIGGGISSIVISIISYLILGILGG